MTVSFRIRVIRGFGTGIVAQAMSSLNNFGIAIWVAHVSPPETYGAFAVAIGLLFVAISVLRSFACTPLLLESGSANRDADGVAGLAVLVGALPAIIVWAVLAGSGTLAEYLSIAFVLGTLPVFLLHDCLRFVAIARDRTELALLLDSVLAGFLATGLTALTLLGAEPELLIAWWAVATGGAAAIGLRILGVRISAREARVLAATRTRGKLSMAVDAAIGSALTQVQSFATAAVGNLSLTAGLRVLYGNTFGAANMFLQGIQPQVTLAARDAPTERRVLGVFLGGCGVAALPVVIIAVLLTAVPQVGVLAGGESFAFAIPYIWPACANVAGIAIASTAVSVLRLYWSATPIRRMRTMTGLVSCAVLVGGVFGPLPLSLQLATYVAAAVNGVIPTVVLLRALRGPLVREFRL